MTKHFGEMTEAELKCVLLDALDDAWRAALTKVGVDPDSTYAYQRIEQAAVAAWEKAFAEARAERRAECEQMLREQYGANIFLIDESSKKH